MSAAPAPDSLSYRDYAHAPADPLAEELREASNRLAPDVVRLRRAIHQAPELAFREHGTAERIAQELRQMDLQPQTSLARTGLSLDIVGEHPGPVLALRADLDALPIQEQNDLPYASQHAGCMHACGHDAHSASLTGVARLLHEQRQHMHGTVRLIYQPSEEKLPGGALSVLETGILQDASAIVGQHVHPLFPVGEVGVKPGPFMASADEIYLTVRGKGGHGAQPHTTVDPVAIAAQLITALQQVVSRRADPRTPSVLTFGKVLANGATNVIPEQVELVGTFRTFSEPWREQAHALIRSLSTGLVEGYGANLDLEIVKGYPVLENDPATTQVVRTQLESYLGAERVHTMPHWMASEDFAWYTHQLPGCFYRLGTASPDGANSEMLHSPRFNIDERALALAPGLMAYTALGLLRTWAQQGAGPETELKL